MKSRLIRFGIGRAAYLSVVTTALVITAVHTFATGGNEPATLPPFASNSTATEFPQDTATGMAPTTTAPDGTSTSANQRSTSTKPPSAGKPSSQGGPSVSVPTVITSSTTTTAVAPTATHQTSPTASPSTTRPTPTTTTLYPPNAIVMVIPFGTFDRIQQGDNVEDVMPSVLNAKVGQTLYLVNKDEYAHLYGNVAVNPYRTTVYPFTYPGDQVGFCTIGPSRVITFRITN